MEKSEYENHKEFFLQIFLCYSLFACLRLLCKTCYNLRRQAISVYTWLKPKSKILVCWVTGLLFLVFVQKLCFFKQELVKAFLVLLYHVVLSAYS